jgi:bacteriocin biosynthesis cyclodehydratase domain-containing protein
MLPRPRFKEQFLVKVLEPDLVFLLTETGHITLEGRLYAMLAPHIDGSNTAEDIVRLLGRLTLLDVEYGLAELEKAGYLAGGRSSEPAGQEAFREMVGADRRLVSGRLRRPVAIKAIGAVEPGALVAAFGALGIRVARRAETTIVVTDDYLRADLADLNREALERRSPWMLVKPVGAVLWIGPIFRPGHTGCWECLADRLRHSPERQIQLGAGPANDHAVLSRAHLPVTIEIASQLAALEVWKWIALGHSERLEGKLVTLDALALVLRGHTLVRRDGCPACVEPKPARKPRPIQLERRLRYPFADGGYRALPPEATYERYQHHVSPLLGVVDKIEPFHRDEAGLVHVHLAGHNFTLKYQRSLFAQWTAGRKSAGKGITRAQSITGALCEALERYSGIFRGNEARKKATFRAFGEQAIHPCACMNFSAAQYAGRDKWNAAEAEFNWVPEPFDEGRRIEWTPVWSLTYKTWRYVPAAYCYYNYPMTEGHDFCRADSNGNAGGNNLEEAILQGFLEVVERDAVAMWWYNRLRRPALDLASFPQPYFERLPDYYRRLGYDVWLLDITSDFAIPAFAAVARGAGALLLGFGAHFDPQIAAARALTEMNQFLPVALAGRNVRLFTSPPRDNQFLVPDLRQASRRLADFEFQPSDDLRDEVERCVARAEKLGLETLVLDQTRPDVGLRVVKVIVPGMRPFWARFAPGRLYDVPVGMGWLPRPRAEGELNPSHLAL